jgi:ssDNA thymidine ADP-ribosyltransferase, DarT
MNMDAFLQNHVAKSVQQNTFFHFTDNQNIELIKQHGLLSRRRLKELGVEIPAPGGNQWSRDAADRLGLDRYVSLCLTKDHPMEYLARQAGQIEQVVYLPIRPDIIKVDGVMMTGGVSNRAGIVPEAPGEVLEQLDLEGIYKRTNWGNDAIKERRKAAVKFEILVPDEVPLRYILS